MQVSNRPIYLALVMWLALLPARAQTVIATVPVAGNPGVTAVNSATNKIYVVSSSCSANPCPVGTVTVIDGATNTTTSVNVGFIPLSLAVNPVTNKIYVANVCGSDPNCSSPGTVTVIDGSTNQTQTVSVGLSPFAVAVNPVTNKIYVTNCTDPTVCHSLGTVTVIDGATNHTTTVNVGALPQYAAINSVTNKIYVVNNCGDLRCTSPGTVTVIDGATNRTTTVPAGAYPIYAAVNSVTNKIYVINTNCGDSSCRGPGTVTVIDGATNNTSTVNVGVSPWRIDVNAVTDRAYVANNCGNDLSCASGTVTVIDGANNTTDVNVEADPDGVAVDSATNKIYVANYCGQEFCFGPGTVSVIDGATNAVTSIPVGYGPTNIVANTTTNRIYAINAQDSTASVIAGANATALQFVPVSPCRLVDTRNPNGPFGGPAIRAGTSRSFPIPQQTHCNIPATAAAYALNVTVVPSGSLGFLTVWTTGLDQPNVSIMNSYDGRFKANAAIVPAGYQGAVSVYASNTTNVVLDINGYFATVDDSTLAFYPLTPCRVADTRKPNGPLGGPYLKANTERDFPVLDASACDIPRSAAAYSLNFTVVPRGDRVFVFTAWPYGLSQPGTSTLNAPTGTVVANAAIVPAGTSGKIATSASADTDLVIDVDGYFAPAGEGGLSLYPVAFCRVLDTRRGNGPFTGMLNPPVGVEGGPCGPPDSAEAYVLNATIVPAAGPVYLLTLWPDGQHQPNVSTLNAFDGAVTSNMAIVPTSNGSIDAYAAGLTQLILDISGYFAP